MDQSEEMALIRQKMIIAREFDLEAEVVYHALLEMKRNVAITPLMALSAGCDEFDI